MVLEIGEEAGDVATRAVGCVHKGLREAFGDLGQGIFEGLSLGDVEREADGAVWPKGQEGFRATERPMERLQNLDRLGVFAREHGQVWPGGSFYAIHGSVIRRWNEQRFGRLPIRRRRSRQIHRRLPARLRHSRLRREGHK